jgi:putative transposase
MVKSPANDRWSSYRFNAQGRAGGLVTPHERYLALGRESPVRQAAYRGLFKTHLDAERVDEIRLACRATHHLATTALAFKSSER